MHINVNVSAWGLASQAWGCANLRSIEPKKRQYFQSSALYGQLAVVDWCVVLDYLWNPLAS